jgi:hypothetical protein
MYQHLAHVRAAEHCGQGGRRVFQAWCYFLPVAQPAVADPSGKNGRDLG